MLARIRNIALCVAAATLATPAAAGGIHVLSAQYGNPQTGELCNAAARIAALCEGQRACSFEVRNLNLCGDPSFLVVKQLAVTYTCGVGRYRTRVSEYDLSTLACN